MCLAETLVALLVLEIIVGTVSLAILSRGFDGPDWLVGGMVVAAIPAAIIIGASPDSIENIVIGDKDKIHDGDI